MLPRYVVRCLPALLALLLAAPLAWAQAAPDTELTAPDGTTVSIERDEYGVPRITAETEAAAFYAQGYAVAQDRLFQMETFWRAATGRISELNGPGTGNANIATDTAIRTVSYTPAERQAQFNALPEAMRTMIESYVAGINAYIALATANPAARPAEYFAPPLASIGIEPWDIPKAMAVMQFFIRRFGESGGQELARLAELQAQGQEWFNANRPINDPTAPTTLPAEPTGLPAAPVAYAGPAVRAEAAAAAAAERAEVEATLQALGIPDKLGSYAAVVAGSHSASGYAMLLGAPQMGLPQNSGPGATNRNVIWESEIIVGSAESPALHIAGMSVAGIPGVIIGRTRDHAWTLTSGNTDNVDTYVVQLVDEEGGYVFDGETRTLETAQETINVLGAAPVTVTRARMVVGEGDERPVYRQDAEAGQVFAYRYAFWGRELDMAIAFYDVWKASTVAEVEAAIAQLPVSFNYFLLHRDQTIGFYHVGRYPVRPGDADPRLPLRGDGTQEWEGFVPFDSLPQGQDPAQGYYVNWNNKPAAWWNHGDIMPWTSTYASTLAGRRSYDGVLELEGYLTEQFPISFEEMKGLHRVARENPRYPEYPGSYQQLIQFREEGSVAENLVPPGQSGFFGLNAQFQVVPSPHTSDQWEMYLAYEMKPFTFAGEPVVSTEPGGGLAGVPTLQAYPNPVAGAAAVRYEVPGGGAARLELFDLLGRSVAVLVDAEVAAGEGRATLDASGLASGLYVLRLQTEEGSVSRRLTVVR